MDAVMDSRLMSRAPGEDGRPFRWPASFAEVPKEVFVRADLFEEELKRIFYADQWIVVGHVAEVPNKGDFKTFSVGRVPLLISRDMQGQVHVFYNSCTHRGTQLETATRGNRGAFNCPYHRWSFNVSGTLVGTPNRPGDFPESFKRCDYDLRRPRMAVVHGLIFVSMGASPPPIEQYLEGITDQIAAAMGGDGDLILLGYQKVLYRANWKTYADNCNYHAGLLHTAFRLLNWSGGGGVQFANARGQRGHTSELSLPKSTTLLKDASLLSLQSHADRKSGSVNTRFFPVSGISRHMDSINIRFANAISVDETEVHYTYFARAGDSEELIRHRIRQASNLLGPCGMVSMEDAAVFHRVHVGSQTPGVSVFLKGVSDGNVMPDTFGQADESANMPFWEYYRALMGFDREQA
jgi:anthranilate 1,2-dioxygenase large subunit